MLCLFAEAIFGCVCASFFAFLNFVGRFLPTRNAIGVTWDFVGLSHNIVAVSLFIFFAFLNFVGRFLPTRAVVSANCYV